MNKIKCQKCGVVNWASAEECLRCKSAIQNYGILAKDITRDGFGGSFGRSLASVFIFGAFGLGMVGLVYTVAFRTPPKPAIAVSNSGATGNQVVLTETEPPADMKVSQPRLAFFSAFVRQEINLQNGSWAAREDGSSSTRPNREQYISDKLGAICRGGGGYDYECKDREKGIRADLNAEEWNRQMANLHFCNPKVDSEIELMEPGKYLNIDEDIFFISKVKAQGLVGANENGACVTKPSVTPLTAHIYLKWSRTRGAEGWQASSKGAMDTLSMDYDKRVKAAKNEELEKARSDRWNEQGRIEANKRMQERVFKALNP